MGREKEPEPFLPGSKRANSLLEEIRRLQSKSLSDIFGDPLSSNTLASSNPKKMDTKVSIGERKIGRGKRWGQK